MRDWNDLMRHQNEDDKDEIRYEQAPLDAIWRPGTIVWETLRPLCALY